MLQVNNLFTSIEFMLGHIAINCIHGHMAQYEHQNNHDTLDNVCLIFCN